MPDANRAGVPVPVRPRSDRGRRDHAAGSGDPADSIRAGCGLRASGLPSPRFGHPTMYPKNVADVDTAFEWPAERMEGSQRVWCRPFPDEADAIMDEFRSLGAEKVRVTPVVPFIVPIAAGFALTVLLGDPFALFI